MQNFQKVFNSVPIISTVAFAIALTMLMFFSYFLASVPSGIQ